MAGKRQIESYTNKSTLEDSDQFLIQESGGTTKKTTFLSFLIDTLQSVYNRGKQIILADETNGELKLKDSATNANRTDILQIIDKDDNVVFAVDKDGVSVGAPPIDSGIYTPTFTNQSNIDSITHYRSFYTKVGNVVTVKSYLNVDIGTTGFSADFNMSLPIASDLSTTINLFGKGEFNQDTFVGLYGDTTNNNAGVTFTSDTSDVGNVFLEFTYLVE